MNEKKIMDCKTITDLESIFDNIFKKTYDHENFLEKVKNSQQIFYSMDSYLEQFFDINKSNSWDIKRRQISDALNSHFAAVENENMNYLNQLKKLNFSFDENFIENYESLLNREFTTIRKLYSKKNYDTPGINHDEEYNDIISGNKFKIAICISDFEYFSDDLKIVFSSSPNTNEDVLYAYLKFTNDKLPQNYNFHPEANDKPVLLKGFLNGLSKFDIYHYDFAESFPTYLNIFLYSKQGYLFGSFRYEIVNKELFKVETVYSENLNKPSFSILEIKIVKAYISKVSQNDLDLKKFLFRPPRYLYNFKIENLIDETDYSDIDTMKINKYSEIFNKYFENEIINKNYIENNSFVKDQLIKNNLTFQLDEDLENKYLYFKTNETSNVSDNLFKTFVGKFINFNSNNSTAKINNSNYNSDPGNNLNNNFNKNSILPDTSIFNNLNIQVTKIIGILLDDFSNTKNSELYNRMNTNKSNRNPSSKISGLEIEPDYISFRTMTKIKNNVLNKLDNTNEIKNILKNWIVKNDTSFEEILYSLVLIDSYSVTIYEKLYLLYQIGKMSNFALCSKDNLTLRKLKEMMYALYKRFMVNFNKSEIDIMIDYLIKKEEFACLRNAIVYNKKDENRIKNIINENVFEQKENILNFLKIKNDKFSEDIKIYLQDYFNLLKNNYLLEKVNINYLNTIWDLFYPKLLKKLKIKPNEILEKWTFNKLSINFTSDNIRKINEFQVNLIDKETFKIDSLNLKERINKNKKEEGVKKVMEELINEDLNSINLSNIESDDSINISYDQFKDVFFNLPFISEFIRASSGFTEENHEGLNIKMHMVKVHLNVGHNYRYFSFCEEIVRILKILNLKNIILI